MRLTLIVGALLSVSAPVRASDVADEAELQFQLGAERYQAGNYRSALEHFLASNRLSPNQAVVFNVARAYEKLNQFPDAYRYYALTAALSRDEAALTRALTQIKRMEPLVAVLDISTKPEGATIYLDRRELGTRGATPRKLGVKPGTYRVFVEKDGYEPAEVSNIEAKIGTIQHVAVSLKEILGTVTLNTGDVHALVRVDDNLAAPSCTTPCNLSLSPGRHVFYFNALGHQPATTVATLLPRGNVTVDAPLTPISGTLFVQVDLRDAVIEIDGKEAGSAPLVVTTSEGAHKVRVRAEGFRTVDRIVTVHGEEQVRVDVTLERHEQVTAASRYAESVETAPGSVTIISREELRGMGYQTVAEALRGVRGLFSSEDGSRTQVGFRGFLRPGDYGTRNLLLLDGSAVNENRFGGALLGYELRTDLDDIERIEIVRGAGSVLYGTGAFFGVINLVSRSHDAPTHGEASLTTAQYGVGNARATAQYRHDKDSGAWVSGALGIGQGRDYFFPEYAKDTTQDIAGNARGLDGSKMGMVSGRAWYKSLTIAGYASTRDHSVPTGAYNSTFGDPRAIDSRTQSQIEGRLEPQITANLQSQSRIYFETSRQKGGHPLPATTLGYNEEAFMSHWVGAEQRFVYDPFDKLRVTLGGEGVWHTKVRTLLSGELYDYVYDDHQPYQTYAGYALADWQVAKQLKVSAGARYDYFSFGAESLSPRLALIGTPTSTDSIKLLFGKAFRAPSVFERTFVSPVIVKSGPLSPETVYSGEIEYTRRLTKTVTAVASTYVNVVDGLIRLVQSTNSGFAQTSIHQNTRAPIMTAGFEFEVKREFRDGYMLAATYSFNQARFLAPKSDGYRDVAYAPSNQGSVKAAAPIVGRALKAMTRVSLEGPRFDRNELETDPTQTKLGGNVVWDLVFSGEYERLHLGYNIGVYNALDYRYNTPASFDFRQVGIPQAGRTFLASLKYSFP